MALAINDDLVRQATQTLQFLAVDAVQKANSGHPGMPMGTARLGFTLWSFVGLLLLPSVSRPAVLAADRSGVLRSEGSAVLQQTLQRLDAMQDGEPRRAAWVESVFHPVPSVQRRIAALRDDREPFAGPWHVARMALFLSWAGSGFLARAVHCNSGRPELWSMLPCD